MPRFEENEILMKEFNSFEMMGIDDFNFAVLASKKKDDEKDNDSDDDFIEEEEDDENPFEKEPTEQDLIENDIPLIDPEDDLLDDDDDVPYNL